jgi:hypothetical protein
MNEFSSATNWTSMACWPSDLLSMVLEYLPCDSLMRLWQSGDMMFQHKLTIHTTNFVPGEWYSFSAHFPPPFLFLFPNLRTAYLAVSCLDSSTKVLDEARLLDFTRLPRSLTSLTVDNFEVLPNFGDHGLAPLFPSLSHFVFECEAKEEYWKTFVPFPPALTHLELLDRETYGTESYPLRNAEHVFGSFPRCLQNFQCCSSMFLRDGVRLSLPPNLTTLDITIWFENLNYIGIFSSQCPLLADLTLSLLGRVDRIDNLDFDYRCGYGEMKDDVIQETNGKDVGFLNNDDAIDKRYIGDINEVDDFDEGHPWEVVEKGSYSKDFNIWSLLPRSLTKLYIASHKLGPLMPFDPKLLSSKIKELYLYSNDESSILQVSDIWRAFPDLEKLRISAINTKVTNENVHLVPKKFQIVVLNESFNPSSIRLLPPTISHLTMPIEVLKDENTSFPLGLTHLMATCSDWKGNRSLDIHLLPDSIVLLRSVYCSLSDTFTKLPCCLVTLSCSPGFFSKIIAKHIKSTPNDHSYLRDLFPSTLQELSFTGLRATEDIPMWQYPFSSFYLPRSLSRIEIRVPGLKTEIQLVSDWLNELPGDMALERLSISASPIKNILLTFPLPYQLPTSLNSIITTFSIDANQFERIPRRLTELCTWNYGKILNLDLEQLSKLPKTINRLENPSVKLLATIQQVKAILPKLKSNITKD